VQAEVVRDIYQRFADGQSHRAIAAGLYPASLMPSRRCLLWLSPQRRLTHAAQTGYSMNVSEVFAIGPTVSPPVRQHERAPPHTRPELEVTHCVIDVWYVNGVPYDTN
jgi:hypothetical protein